MSGEGLILGAGGITFAAHFKESGGFPETGYAIIGATVALTFLAATVKGGPLGGPVKALGILMVIGALYQAIPMFANNARPTKGKKNG